MISYWVTCEEYTAGPFTPERAERMAVQIAEYAEHDLPHACRLEHRVVASDAAPVPPWKREGEH